MGKVPAEMLTFDSADHIYQYAEKRVKNGPTGYIVCSGCDIPHNAKYKAAKVSNR